MLSQMLQIVDLNDTQNSHGKRNQENENLFKKRILLDKVESGKTALKQIHTSNSFTRAHTQFKKNSFFQHSTTSLREICAHFKASLNRIKQRCPFRLS